MNMVARSFIKDLSANVPPAAIPLLCGDDFVGVDLETGLLDLVDKGHTCYFHIAQYEDMPARNERGNKKMDGWLPCLVADIDVLPKEKRGSSFPYPTEYQLLSILEKLTVKPTVLIKSSGSGYYGVWQVTEPSRLQDPITDEALKMWGESLKRIWHAHGVTLDVAVAKDKARVLRIPGSTNTKYDPSPTVDIVATNPIFKGGILDLAGAMRIGAQRFDKVQDPHTANLVKSSGAEFVELSPNYCFTQVADLPEIFSHTTLSFMDGDATVAPTGYDRQLHDSSSSTSARSVLLSYNGNLVCFSETAAQNLSALGCRMKLREGSSTVVTSLMGLAERLTEAGLIDHETYNGWMHAAAILKRDADLEYNERLMQANLHNKMPPYDYPFKEKLLAAHTQFVENANPDEPLTFPIEVFPDSLYKIMEDRHNHDASMMNVLLAGSLAVLGTASCDKFIRRSGGIGEDGMTKAEILNMMVVVSADSGVGKSGMHSFLTESIRACHLRNHRKTSLRRIRQKERFVEVDKQYKEQGSQAPPELIELWGDLDREINMPYPELVCESVTVEKLERISTHPLGTLFHTPEERARRIFDSEMIGMLLKMFSNDTHERSLVGKAPDNSVGAHAGYMNVGRANGSSLLFSQRKRTHGFLYQDVDGLENGNTARFLHVDVVAPDMVFLDGDESEPESSKQFHRVVRKLCELHDPEDPFRGPTINIAVSHDAKRHYKTWVTQEIYGKTNNPKTDPHVVVFGRKVFQIAERVAVLFAIWDEFYELVVNGDAGTPESILVKEDHMRAATVLMSWSYANFIAKLGSELDVEAANALTKIMKVQATNGGTFTKTKVRNVTKEVIDDLAERRLVGILPGRRFQVTRAGLQLIEQVAETR